jgi:aldehyde dehydrogenase (NAD+)
MTIYTEPVASLRHSDRFFIGGDWVQPSTDASIDVIDSASEEVFLSVAEAKEADMSRAVGAAREAFDNDELGGALAEAFSQVRVGDSFDSSSQMGPLAAERQRDRVEEYIAIGKAEGAILATGGGRPSHLERGYYIEPTVFGNVDNSSTIACEEIFGPVLSVIPADDEDQAIAIADDSPYGLNSCVFTDDIDRARYVASGLRAGTVGHNAFRTDFGIAFGGFKQSGIGREGGAEGLHPFLETKTVILEGRPTGYER